MVNIRTRTELVFSTKDIPKQIFYNIFHFGSEILKNSRKHKYYGVSLREILCLSLLTTFRSFVDGEEDWYFTTDSKISDDGAVVRIDGKKTAFYIEHIEQIYLPGNFLIRERNKSMTEFILDQVKKKNQKGTEYCKDKSLFVFCDVSSKNIKDTFDWKIFVKGFFLKDTFLHVYFTSLIRRTSNYNEYYFLSFTNQKHRQGLNGEFKFKINENGIFDFICTQKMNLLKNNPS